LLSDDAEIRQLRAEIERLKARQDELDRRLAAFEARAHFKPKSTDIPTVEGASQPRRAALETRFGLMLLNRVGVITLILGAAFFFKYAVENQWIGPGARVLLGLAAALAALWAGGRHRPGDDRLFGNGLTGLGVALLFVSFYFGYGYRLLDAPVALMLMLMAAAAAMALAVRYESAAVAALGLLGGYLTPLFIRPPDAALDVYVAILGMSALWLARRYPWRVVEAFALAFTAMLYASTIFQPNFGRLLASVFLVVFAAAFTAARTPAVVDAAHVLAMLALVRVWGGSPGIYLLCTLALAAAGLAIAFRLGVRSLPGAALAAYWIAFALWSPRPGAHLWRRSRWFFDLFRMDCVARSQSVPHRPERRRLLCRRLPACLTRPSRPGRPAGAGSRGSALRARPAPASVARAHGDARFGNRRGAVHGGNSDPAGGLPSYAGMGG
jgi:uncharacterized membrane protein